MPGYVEAQKQRSADNWDDLDEAIHRNILKRTSIRGWFYVTFTKPRKTKQQPRTLPRTKTKVPEYVFKKGQFERLNKALNQTSEDALREARRHAYSEGWLARSHYKPGTLAASNPYTDKPK